MPELYQWILLCVHSPVDAHEEVDRVGSRGGLIGSFNAHEYIRHIAMSSDGSVIVATSDERVYAFSPGSFPKINSAPSRTMTPEKKYPGILTGANPCFSNHRFCRAFAGSDYRNTDRTTCNLLHYPDRDPEPPVI